MNNLLWGKGEQDGDTSHEPPPPVATLGLGAADFGKTCVWSFDILDARPISIANWIVKNEGPTTRLFVHNFILQKACHGAWI